ncbi:MAG: hypothetical protein NWR72_12960 [Bacteroidia bacterium]|nr:hypothetical protein [Bacteroidia bacterium]
MKKGTSLWIMLAAAILLAIVYVAFINKDRQSTLDPNEIDFAIADTAAVVHIRLTQTQEGKDLSTVNMAKSPDGIWTINNAYRGFTPQIGHLLTTMSRLQVRESLTGKGEESAEKIISLMHTRVEVFDAKGPIKTYFLASSAKDNRGSVMKLKGADHPYIVERPDLQGFVNPFFTIDVDVWRERLLWRAKASELKEIRVEFTHDPAATLWLAHLPEQAWTLQPGGSSPNPEKLEAYLSMFQGAVFAESFAERTYPGKKEELLTQTPDIRIRLRYLDDSERELVLFERTDNVNSFFGWITGEEELYTVQHYVIDKFLLTQQAFSTDPT